MCRGYFLSFAVNFKQVPGKHKANYADGLVHEVSLKHAFFFLFKNTTPAHTSVMSPELILVLISEAEKT